MNMSIAASMAPPAPGPLTALWAPLVSCSTECVLWSWRWRVVVLYLSILFSAPLYFYSITIQTNIVLFNYTYLTTLVNSYFADLAKQDKTVLIYYPADKDVKSALTLKCWTHSASINTIQSYNINILQYVIHNKFFWYFKYILMPIVVVLLFKPAVRNFSARKSPLTAV